MGKKQQNISPDGYSVATDPCILIPNHEITGTIIYVCLVGFCLLFCTALKPYNPRNSIGKECYEDTWHHILVHIKRILTANTPD